MQKFAIAIGLLLSLLFLTGSNVNAETAMFRQNRLERAPHIVDTVGSATKPANAFNPKAS